MLWRTVRIWERVTIRIMTCLLLLFISHYLIHVLIPQISIGYHSKGPHPFLEIDIHISHNLKRLTYMSLLWTGIQNKNFSFMLGIMWCVSLWCWILSNVRSKFISKYSTVKQLRIACFPIACWQKKHLKLCFRVSVIVLVPW